MGNGLKRQFGFTPHGVARALRDGSQETPRENPRSQPSSSKEPNLKVQVNAGDVLGGLVQAARFVDGYARRRREERRRELDQSVLTMASQYKGFVGVPDLLSSRLCERKEGVECFQRLQREGHCQWLCEYHDEPLYVFPAFLVRTWVCHHCDARYPVTELPTQQTRFCECCGAGLEQVIE